MFTKESLKVWFVLLIFVWGLSFMSENVASQQAPSHGSVHPIYSVAPGASILKYFKESGDSGIAPFKGGALSAYETSGCYFGSDFQNYVYRDKCLGPTTLKEYSVPSASAYGNNCGAGRYDILDCREECLRAAQKSVFIETYSHSFIQASCGLDPTTALSERADRCYCFPAVEERNEDFIVPL